MSVLNYRQSRLPAGSPEVSVMTGRFIKFTWAIVLVFLLLPACFHKSVEKDEADDIVKVILAETPERAFLVAQETIFQAVSKSSGSGGTHISGYEESRISVYDISTGHLQARKAFGKRMKTPVCLLGFCNGQIWLFSGDEELGLHSRDPLTMEVNITQGQLLKDYPQLLAGLAQPEWYKLDRMYAYDETKDRLVVTDNRGYRYLIDPRAFSAEKLTGDYRMPANRTDFFTTNVDFQGKYLGLRGDLRKTLHLGSQAVDTEYSFLDGKFLKDQNIMRIYKQVDRQFTQLKDETDKMQQEFDALDAKRKGASRFDPDFFREFSDARSRLSRKKNEYDKVARLRGQVLERDVHSLNILLQPEPGTFFIIHRTTIDRDARMIVSLVELNDKLELRQVWESHLEDLFFDYNAARQTSSFKIVFSKGSPSFDFKFFDISGNKLVIIYMLHAHCLDLETGSVLWKFRI